MAEKYSQHYEERYEPNAPQPQPSGGGGGRGGLYAILIIIVILLVAAFLYFSGAFGPAQEAADEGFDAEIDIEAPEIPSPEPEAPDVQIETPDIEVPDTVTVQ